METSKRPDTTKKRKHTRILNGPYPESTAFSITP